MWLTSPKPIEPTEPHADLLATGQALIHDSRYHITLKFVHGHQDMGNPMVLTRDTWLNVEANLLVKAKVVQQHQGPQYYTLLGHAWGCYIGNKCIVNCLVQLPQWQRNFKVLGKAKTDELRTAANHRLALRCAMRSVPLAHCWWASKQMSGHLLHGKNMVKWKFWNMAQCPWCGLETEDKPHII